MNYKEQYSHPKWQKKRLEILERDDWKCQSCGNTKSTLHVHHMEYIKDNKIWDYDNNNFITYCESCHEIIHGFKKDIKYVIDNSFVNTINLEYLYYIIVGLSNMYVDDMVTIGKVLDIIIKKPVRKIINISIKETLSELKNKQL